MGAGANTVVKTLLGGPNHVTRLCQQRIADRNQAGITSLDIVLICVGTRATQRERSPVTRANLVLFKRHWIAETQARAIVDTDRHYPYSRANRNYPGGSRGCYATSTAARAGRYLGMCRGYAQYRAKETRYVSGRLDYYFLVVWSYNHCDDLAGLETIRLRVARRGRNSLRWLARQICSTRENTAVARALHLQLVEVEIRHIEHECQRAHYHWQRCDNQQQTLPSSVALAYPFPQFFHDTYLLDDTAALGNSSDSVRDFNFSHRLGRYHFWSGAVA